MPKSHFIEAAELCIANGERLLYDAEFIAYPDHPAGTPFVLARIAQEEFAKAFLLFLVARGIIPWNGLVNRAMLDHTCKQLLGLVINHLNADWDDDRKRHDEFDADIEEHKRLIAAHESSSDGFERARIWERIEEIGKKLELYFSLPQAVTDAIFILRHEKIGRWESPTWDWEEEPKYDPVAKNLADGKLDREKQDALYVRLGREGHVATNPAQVKYEGAKAAMEVANRMRFFVKYLLSQDDGSGRDYDKIESAFKSAFASLSEKTAEKFDLKLVGHT